MGADWRFVSTYAQLRYHWRQFRKRRSPGRLLLVRGLHENGAGEETRTLDVHLGKVVLYQLSYARKSGCKE